MSALEVENLRQRLQTRPLEPVRVTPPEEDSRTPHRRRRAAAVRMPPLPGMSLRSLRTRDPLAALTQTLAVEIEKGRASLVGVPRQVARDLALDAGLKTMFDPIRGCQVIRSADVPELVDHIMARGHTVVVRPEAA